MEGRIDHLEGQYWKKQERIWQLEQLCRDCYYCLENAVKPECMAADLHIKKRMAALGLLEGGDNERNNHYHGKR